LNIPFIFTQDDTTYFAEVTRYKQGKAVIGDLKKLRMEDKINNRYFALFSKLEELAKLSKYVKTPEPESYGITQDQIDEFICTDRYVTGILLLKELEKEKNEKINNFRRETIQEWNRKKSALKEFTKNMKIKYESK